MIPPPQATRHIRAEIRRANLDRRHARPLGSDPLPQAFGGEPIGALQQFAQGSFHHRLTVGCGNIKNAHILRVSSITVKAAQRIIGAAKDQAGEQFLAPAIAGKCAGFFTSDQIT